MCHFVCHHLSHTVGSFVSARSIRRQFQQGSCGQAIAIVCNVDCVPLCQGVCFDGDDFSCCGVVRRDTCNAIARSVSIRRQFQQGSCGQAIAVVCNIDGCSTGQTRRVNVDDGSKSLFCRSQLKEFTACCWYFAWTIIFFYKGFLRLFWSISKCQVT